jgi:hypothetical protein
MIYFFGEKNETYQWFLVFLFSYEDSRKECFAIGAGHFGHLVVALFHWLAAHIAR